VHKKHRDCEWEWERERERVSHGVAACRARIACVVRPPILLRLYNLTTRPSQLVQRSEISSSATTFVGVTFVSPAAATLMSIRWPLLLPIHSGPVHIELSLSTGEYNRHEQCTISD
jgi:hypothetical protein